MKTLKSKLKKQGGFTLVEMLTVVAIIAILIAISIPMVMGALDRAKKATDAANIRAAKAAISIDYLTNSAEYTGTGKSNTRVYDAETGTLKAKGNPPSNGYRQYSTDADNGKFIFVAVYKETVYYQWADSMTDDAADDNISNWKTEIPNPDAP